MGEKAIAIVSGGMDSTVLAYLLAEANELTMVSFDYNQRHRKELKYAATTARKLNVRHIIVPVGFLSQLLHGSALTSPQVDVPEGHYADDNMRLTVVPNRNSIMLNIAAGIAIAEGAAFVATAVHAGDHAVYPDCRPDFISSLTTTLKVANEGFIDDSFTIEAPFVNQSKTWIAKLGTNLGVPFEDTWSCYNGREIHCGRCGTCVERKEAFRDSNVPDPTEYMDEEFGVSAFRG